MLWRKLFRSFYFQTKLSLVWDSYQIKLKHVTWGAVIDENGGEAVQAAIGTDADQLVDQALQQVVRHLLRRRRRLLSRSRF